MTMSLSMAVTRSFETDSEPMFDQVFEQTKDSSSSSSSSQWGGLSSRKCKCDKRRMKQKDKKKMMRALEAGEHTSTEYLLLRDEASAKHIEIGPSCAKVPLPRWNFDAPPNDQHFRYQ